MWNISRDTIKNEDISGKMGMALMMNKMRETAQIFQVCEVVEHRCSSEEVRQVDNNRSKDGEVIRQDMSYLQLTNDMTPDGKI